MNLEFGGLRTQTCVGKGMYPSLVDRQEAGLPFLSHSYLLSQSRGNNITWVRTGLNSSLLASSMGGGPSWTGGPCWGQGKTLKRPIHLKEGIENTWKRKLDMAGDRLNFIFLLLESVFVKKENVFREKDKEKQNYSALLFLISSK